MKASLKRWSWCGVALLSLVLGLLSFQTAFADSSTATITLFAPGATLGAPVSVQYQSPSGEWFTVPGWQGTLDRKTDAGVPYKIWAVSKQAFGQGPFRWVVYAADGKTPWATSDIFSLPPGGGMDRSETIRSNNLAINAAVAQAGRVPELSAGSTIGYISCPTCKPHAHITAYINGLPAASWIVVQWLDGNGTWQPVTGWESNAHKFFVDGQLKTWTPTGQGVLFLQWSVLRANYGQGPFRWAVFSGPNGTLLGVSPKFNLPTIDGADSVMYLSK